jgi:predicted amidohydrolase YtcJ
VPCSSSPTADLLLYGGRVLTLDPAPPHAAAVAVAAGKILAIGGEQELRPFVTAHTQTIACRGQTVIPGFIDPHLHLFSWASRRCGVDVSPARSVADIQTLLAQHLPCLSAKEWLRGYGYDEFLLNEKRHPTKKELDQVSREHPIILRHRTGHAAALNSVALQQVGITYSFTPPGGGSIERDPQSGEPTGVTYELEKFLRTVLPPLSSQSFMGGVRQVTNALLQQGVTSFHDASAGNTMEDVALFRRLHADGFLQSRATIMLGIEALPQIVEAGMQPFSGNEHVRLGSVKIMVHESHGEIYPPLEELTTLVWQAHQRGFQVALHAVEEAAVCAALTAIEEAQTRLPGTDLRHRIEHCALCPPPLIETFLATGSAVVTQPAFLHFYGEKYAAEVDPDLQSWLYRTKSLLTQGVPVAGSSDCPIAPLSPLLGVQAAITRQSQTGILLNPHESLGLHEALALFTSAGAWVGFEEHDKGKIKPGMLADLAVLNGDLMKTPVEEIGNLQVAMTIIGGKIAWSA